MSKEKNEKEPKPFKLAIGKMLRRFFGLTPATHLPNTRVDDLPIIQVSEKAITDLETTPTYNPRLGRQIISRPGQQRFCLSGDPALFARIVDDMLQNGGELIAAGAWKDYSCDELSTTKEHSEQDFADQIDSIFTTRFKTMSLMMDPWIGQVGMQPVNQEYAAIYLPVLGEIDHCDLVGEDLMATAKHQDMLNTDLGSIMDVNLLAGFAPLKSEKIYNILEVGGGYGRLAEALTNGIDCNFHYVLVDAVPGSLLYAKIYLENAFPEKRIGFYLNDPYDSSYDFYILAPWHLDRLTDTAFDLCINIESMQEMEQRHVDYYLQKFDHFLKEDGVLYISNSRAYRYQGPWNFPPTWQMLLYHNTPRSWTNNHPTIIMQKINHDCQLQNRILSGMHALQISDWDLRLENIKLHNEIKWRDEELAQHRSAKEEIK